MTVDIKPVIVISGEYVAGATVDVPMVAAVAVHTVPGGVAITKDVALDTLTIGYQPAGKVPVIPDK